MRKTWIVTAYIDDDIAQGDEAELVDAQLRQEAFSSHPLPWGLDGVTVTVTLGPEE